MKSLKLGFINKRVIAGQLTNTMLGGILVVATMLSIAGIASAQLAPTGGPTSAGTQMPTFTQIYNRFSTGASSAVQSSFTAPASGPTVPTMYTLNAIMGIAPALDTTNGAVTADVLSGKTFWGLRSGGGWGLLTGTGTGGGNSAVPKTGQTTSYATGDDGDLERGVTWPSPRFTDNSNGTVTDNLTGLIWLKNANCYGTRTWALALTDSNALANGTCSLTDGSTAGQWRLPNRKELRSLIDHKNSSPALPTGHPFTSVKSIYWSSTTYAPSTAAACFVSLAAGYTSTNDKAGNLNVWPVR